MNQYEFSEIHNKRFTSLARKLRLFAIFFILIGLIVLLAGIGIISTYLIGGITSMLVGLTYIGQATVLLRPSDNLKRVANTEGADMTELMTAMKELNSGFRIVKYLVIVGIVASIVSVAEVASF